MKKLYYLILPVITLLFGFIFTSNTYAVDDISVTVSSGTFNSDVFSNCDSTCLKQYKYLIVESDSNFYGDPSYFYFLVPKTNNTSNTARFFIGGLTYGMTDHPVYSVNQLPFDDTFNNVYLQYGGNFTFSSDVTFTLTESLPSNTPDCPEPPAPEPCDCDDAFIVGLFKDSFWQVATAIVALIVPILALFLLFRLVHGLMFGKGI